MIKKLNFLKLLPLVLLAMSVIACDPTHKDKCEWYLVPEPSQINLVPEGWVSLCARNFVINKQKCYLKSTIEFAKAVNGRTFRLSRLKIDETGPYPREVLKISACQAEEAEVERLAKEPKREESE